MPQCVLSVCNMQVLAIVYCQSLGPKKKRSTSSISIHDLYPYMHIPLPGLPEKNGIEMGASVGGGPGVW